MNTFLRLFSNILLLGRIRYSLSQDACQKMSKPTTSPDYQPLIISVSKNREWGKWGMSGEKIHKKNGDSVPDNFHFPPKNSFVSPRIPDFFIALDSFPAIQESMVTPKESTKARKMKQI